MTTETSESKLNDYIVQRLVIDGDMSEGDAWGYLSQSYSDVYFGYADPNHIGPEVRRLIEECGFNIFDALEHVS